MFGRLASPAGTVPDHRGADVRRLVVSFCHRLHQNARRTSQSPTARSDVSHFETRPRKIRAMPKRDANNSLENQSPAGYVSSAGAGGRETGVGRAARRTWPWWTAAGGRVNRAMGTAA